MKGVGRENNLVLNDERRFAPMVPGRMSRWKAGGNVVNRWGESESKEGFF